MSVTMVPESSEGPPGWFSWYLIEAVYLLVPFRAQVVLSQETCTSLMTAVAVWS